MRVKALVWTATGDRAFSSGADLRGQFTSDVPEETIDAYLAENMAPSDDMVRVDSLWTSVPPCLYA